MPHDDIPNMFGRGTGPTDKLGSLPVGIHFCDTSKAPKTVICAVLSGTKYGLKQTRGKFGLGAKMVIQNQN